MPPEIMKTALLDEWVVVTKSTKKDGIAFAHEGKKYPIPQKTIEAIVNDYLVKGLEGCERGYNYKIVKQGQEICKVTVERINKNEEI